MSINQTCLESEIQTAVDNLTTSCGAEVFLETALAADNANVNRKFSVALGCQLPDLQTANIPAGTMVFVDELGVPLVATLKAWTGLDGRTYRQDIADQTLYTWGNNSAGQLGANLSTTESRSSPIQEITSSGDWITVSASGRCFMNAVKIDGSLWGWGCNTFGQLADGGTTNRCSPVREITSSNNWCGVSTGGRNGVAIKTTGQIWSWGENNGNHGNNSTIRSSSPVQEITSSSDWKQVSAGGYAAIAIKLNGTLWYIGGSSTSSPSGLNVPVSSPVQEISSSTNWCYVGGSTNAIKTDGSLWSWGFNNDGRVGDGTSGISRSSPVREASSSSNWVSITKETNQQKIAIKADGTLWGWGPNGSGQLGTNNLVVYSSPVQEVTSSTDWCYGTTSYSSSAGVKTTGQLFVWGSNACGMLGTNDLTNTSSPVQEITSATDWAYVTTGEVNKAALKSIV